jgi:uncharacterized protein (TIGR02271 family)
METTDSAIRRIRPGVPVECSDGLLGRVERIEHDDSGAPESISVAREGAGPPLLIPLDLVRAVDQAGTVRLSCARGQVDRLLERSAAAEGVRSVELLQEELVPHKETVEAGRIRVRKQVEDVPRRLEVDAYHEEVTVEHVPIGRVVKEREGPREEDGVYIVPIYEEQLVVVKRLVLTEEIRIRRQGATERRLFEDTVRRERLVIEDPDRTGRVHEQYSTEQPEGERVAGDTVRGEEESDPEAGGLLEKLGRKVLE